MSGAAMFLGATPPPPVPSIPPPPDQSFAAFVVGESNQAAYRAATALARGEIGGPLLLHGPSGVGKTHLLHATYAGLAERGCGVACLAAHDLTQALLAARRANQAAAFWRELGALDALLLDDVHSLAGDEPLQGELADALAAWVEGGRILAVTTDRPPDEVPETGRWCPRDGAATAFGLSARRLRGRGGGGELVLPRRVAMWLLHRLLGLPAPEIGRLFHRDRTTVHHACRGLPARLARDAELARTVRQIEERLVGTT